MNPLLRYIHNDKGPISFVSSSLELGLWKPQYWHSVARLSDEYRSTFGSRFSIPVLAKAWDSNKQQSQEKAILAALLLWVQEIYKNHAPIIGKDINTSDAGFALGSGLSEDEVHKIAHKNAVHDWAKQQTILRPDWFFSEAQMPLRSRFRKLLPSKEGSLSLLRTSITVEKSRRLEPVERSPLSRHLEPVERSPLSEDLSFVLGIFQFKTGECLLASACEETQDQAMESAIRAVYARYHVFKRVRRGEEQLLDTMEMQRLWLFATDPDMGAEAVASLRTRVRSESTWALKAPLLFSKTISGPWDKDFIVHRMLFTKSPTHPETLYELPL